MFKTHDPRNRKWVLFYINVSKPTRVWAKTLAATLSSVARYCIPEGFVWIKNVEDNANNSGAINFDNDNNR